MLSQRSLPASGSMNWVSSSFEDEELYSEPPQYDYIFCRMASLKSYVAFMLIWIGGTNIGKEKNEMPKL